MEHNVKNLIDDFVEEKENGFYASVYEQYYASIASSFDDAVAENCKIVLFGNEYKLSARELYDYDRSIAVEAWINHVDHQFGDFHDWVSEVVQDDLKDFTNGFQQWLSEQDDEWTSNVIVALMGGGIDLTKIIVDWLYERLQREDWPYPA